MEFSLFSSTSIPIILKPAFANTELNGRPTRPKPIIEITACFCLIFSKSMFNDI